MLHYKIAQIDGAEDDISGIDTESDDNDTAGTSKINNDKSLNENCARLLLTNARSIMPKTQSLIDAFESLDPHFACITETWYRGGPT